MLEDTLKLAGAQAAIEAFGSEYARSSDFGKAWNVLIDAAWKNGSAVPLIIALSSDAWAFIAKNPWAQQQWNNWWYNWFNPKR